MIAIKGLEMPKCCHWDCDLVNEDGGACPFDVYEPKTDTTKERAKGCPLIEIVTCKDCKHYKYHGANGYCSKRVNTDSNIDVYREPDYFCALGERSE